MHEEPRRLTFRQGEASGRYWVTLDHWSLGVQQMLARNFEARSEPTWSDSESVCVIVWHGFRNAYISDDEIT